MLRPRVHDRRIFTVVLFGLIALAWVALFAWQVSPYGRFLNHEQLADIEFGFNGNALGFAALFVSGWTLMTFAMMLPTSLPLIQMFQKMTRDRENGLQLIALPIGGISPYGRGLE